MNVLVIIGLGIVSVVAYSLVASIPAGRYVLIHKGTCKVCRAEGLGALGCYDFPKTKAVLMGVFWFVTLPALLGLHLQGSSYKKPKQKAVPKSTSTTKDLEAWHREWDKLEKRLHKRPE